MWIELHHSLPRHPKLARLASRLRINRAQAAGHLTFLWLWALDYAPHGSLSAHEPAEISAAADFGGDPDHFANALRESGWVDEDGMIHDWHDYGGKLFDSRLAERERSRRRRNAEKEALRPDSRADHTTTDDCPDDDRRTTAGRPLAHNSTVHDITVQNQKEEDRRAEAQVCEPAKPDRSRFSKPTQADMELHAAKIGLPTTEIPKFWSYYEANGWKVGRNPMKSWQAAMVNWRTNYEERRSSVGNGPAGQRTTAAEQRRIACDPERNGATPHDFSKPLPFA